MPRRWKENKKTVHQNIEQRQPVLHPANLYGVKQGQVITIDRSGVFPVVHREWRVIV